MAIKSTIYCFLEHDYRSDVDAVDLKEISYELLTEAEKLKRQMNATLIGVAISDRRLSPSALRQLSAFPLDGVYHYRYPDNVCLMDICTLVVKKTLNSRNPFLVLVGNTIVGTSIANSIASALEIVFVSNNVEVNFRDNVFEVLRPVFNGQVYTKYTLRFSGPVIFSIKPGIIGYLKKTDSHGIDRDVTEYELERDQDSKVCEIRLLKGDHRKIDLTEADIVVGIGKGVLESGCLDQALAFADAIRATYGCTRPLVDAGLFPLARQIGITGKIISPRVYIALGISGTDHHTKGILGAENVVAVNVDRNAPLLKIADVGFVGDLRLLLPSMTERISAFFGAVNEQI